MKVLVVIVHREDADAASTALRKDGFRFTALPSTGGFLREESSTFLLGVKEERMDDCLEIFRTHCQSRTVGAPGSFRAGKRVDEGDYIEKYQPATVEVGGAVAFAVDGEKVL